MTTRPAGSAAAEAADPRFFRRSGPQTLADIARAAGAALAGRADDPDRTLTGVAPVSIAGPGHVTFLDNPKLRPLLAATGAGAVIVTRALADSVPDRTAALVVPRVAEGWARVCALFAPPDEAAPGIHPAALVDPAARVDQAASVGPFAVIGADAEIGPRTVIGAHTAILPGCVIGADCRIAAHVSVSHALIGDRVVLHPGVRIGQAGFGFAMTEHGFIGTPQLGRVVIGDDVDIGANSTVDRGSLGDTVIGAGSRLDNLVQIAHNVRLGRCCVIVAQAGVSGSAILEDFVVLGGQSGVVGHVTLGARARVAAASAVMGDVPAGTDMAGLPALPGREYLRGIAVLRRLARRVPRA